MLGVGDDSRFDDRYRKLSKEMSAGGEEAELATGAPVLDTGCGTGAGSDCVSE